MKEKFNTILSDQFVRISLLLSLVFIIPLITIIIVTYGNLPPLIPFFNSMPWGEQRLIASNVTVILPILLVAIFVGDIVTGKQIGRAHV